MEHQVNGGIIDGDQPVEQTTLQDSGPNMETHNLSGGSEQNNQVDWEKRYKDSSREATRMSGQLKALSPFVPLLKAMRQDSGLVDTVRDYLQGGGKPSKSIKEQLNLPEDFVFDQEEAFNEPDSNSAKLLNSHVDGIVQTRVSDIMQKQQQTQQSQQLNAARETEVSAFKKKFNMSDEQFADMMKSAKGRKMTLEDVHFLVNKERANANVANSTKNDMMNQMRQVRDIPTTAGGVNSPRSEQSQDDQIFDDLMGSGGSMEELFG